MSALPKSAAAMATERSSDTDGTNKDFLESLAKAKELAAKFASAQSSGGDKQGAPRGDAAQKSKAEVSAQPRARTDRGRSASPNYPDDSTSNAGSRFRSRSKSPSPSTEIAAAPGTGRVVNDTFVSSEGRSPLDGGLAGGAYVNPNMQGMGGEQYTVLGEVVIPNNMVGYVIGRGGENVKRIVNETGCKVQFDPVADSPVRRAVLVGRSGARVEQAKMIIQQLAAERTPDQRPTYHSSNSQIPTAGMVNEDMAVEQVYVGLIIGKGGETIRSIVEKSGCKLFFAPEAERDPETGNRILKLTGTAASVECAKRTVNEIIQNSLQHKGNSARPGQFAGYNASGGNPHSSGLPANNQRQGYQAYNSRLPPVQETLIVPLEYAGRVIGTAGVVIKAIGREFRCLCRALPMDDPQSVQHPGKRVFVLSGQQHAVDQAKARIMSIVSESESQGGGHEQRSRPSYPFSHAQQSSQRYNSSAPAPAYQSQRSSAYDSTSAYTIDTGTKGNGSSAHSNSLNGSVSQDNTNAWNEYYKQLSASTPQAQEGDQGDSALAVNPSQYAQDPTYQHYLQYYQSLYQQQQQQQQQPQ